ncbi:MFS transporter [Paraburkholderia sp. A1RI-2L]|uniref:MFS transporter n=1 Tax=Paraburkholderia sp. A1RI-2L TaxID=3028367 RepID=UPI003B80F0BD
MLEENIGSFAGRAVPVRATRSRVYPWVVFGLIFGLMLSDYMSRQVLNAVFPQLKSQWHLADAQLGLLSGVVGLMVGMLAFPAALLADRWNRTRSVVLMALFWSLATLGCGVAENYGHMLTARLLVGIGEAGYGSVGLAIILSVFPASMRATLTGAFTSAGMLGSVLGMAAGGVVAARLGWRAAFVGMALFGLLLVLACAATVTEARVKRHARCQEGGPKGVSESLPKLVRSLLCTPTLVFTYLGSGLQLFTAYAIIAWLPSYLNRYHHMAPAKAALSAAVMLIVSGVGMALCGMVTDWAARKSARSKVTLAIGYCLGSCVLLMIAMRMGAGGAQFAVLAAGVFLAAGTWGAAGAMTTNLVHASMHSTALATLTLANNLLGGAPGPYVTGVLADRIGLLGALQWIPLVCVGAALAFACARGTYERDLNRFQAT